MSTLKLLTYAYACQSPLTPTRKTCSLVLTGTERLSLFRTVFVQVAALLLFAAGGMLLAGAVNAADFLEAYSQLGQDQAQPRMGEHK